jgi:hypothetical protein
MQQFFDRFRSILKFDYEDTSMRRLAIALSRSY